jgi:hypothetical protein
MMQLYYALYEISYCARCWYMVVKYEFTSIAYGGGGIFHVVWTVLSVPSGGTRLQHKGNVLLKYKEHKIIISFCSYPLRS